MIIIIIIIIISIINISNTISISISISTGISISIIISIIIIKWLFCTYFPDNSDPGDNKKTKDTKSKTLSSGVLAAAVVGFLIILFLVILLLHLAIKKLRKNVKAHKRGSAKYVNDSNISSNGKAVTIGTRNKGFDDEIGQSESALY